ncbi:hypothetical protein PILCRDRAFT_751870 [Piloderma croceum F 1598]|uniref:Uncharacterized protein n=1 Tax=Piloderma croceum (strain F 1598) TaxID=765440 RepID=A0A0C3B311_PILCF|nr:hypothetical protein PILCRDRAFT_751870 [Piloderma croceum F 1598]
MLSNEPNISGETWWILTAGMRPAIRRVVRTAAARMRNQFHEIEFCTDCRRCYPTRATFLARTCFECDEFRGVLVHIQLMQGFKNK